MTEIIIAFVAVLAGLIAGLLIGSMQKKEMFAMQKQSSDTEKENQKKSYDQIIESLKSSHASEIETLNREHANQIAAQKEQVEKEREYAQQMINAANENLAKEKENEATLRAENNKQWAEKLETLKQSILKMTMDQLASKQNDLQENNKAQISDLLKPIKEQFNDFKKSVDDSKTQNELNKEQIKETFKSTMDLFQQAQDIAVKTLKEQTEKIGNDASNLTKALKGESKTQGDWGEMVLQTILENSGLHKDEEYFVQENVKDENGNNYRPDIIVKIPNDKGCIVIDSKVSLTAYSNAIAEDDEILQEKYLKEHVKSVRKHVDELADKHYETIVDQTIGFVLMFIPNEYSYIVAMKQDPQLNLYAYRKKIVIISPSNLLMALQLVYNLWQTDKQNKNVEKIVKTAADLYDKVVGFTDTFENIGEQIEKVNKSFEKAKGQLCTGKGNVLGRVEKLKEMGVNPKRSRKALPDEEE